MIELPKEKPSLEEAYENTLEQFGLGLSVVDLMSERLEILQKKKLKRGKDKEVGIILEGILLLMKATTDSLSANWRITYLLRDLAYDYDVAIKQITESVESLAKESTNKTLTNKILEGLVKLENQYETIRENQNSLSVGVADARNDLDEFRKAEEKFWEQSAKRKTKGGKKDG